MPLVRARVFAGDQVSVEGVYVPIFRRGRFDRLDEPTSPFNIEPGAVTCLAVGCPRPVFVPNEPAATAANAQGGARVERHVGARGLVGVGLPGFPAVRDLHAVAACLAGAARRRGGLSIEYPRFTMLGGDFETVAGPWVVRGEVAAFTRDAFQAPAAAAALTGQSFDAGAAVDRKAGDYRISGQVLVHREAYDPAFDVGGPDATSR